MLPELTQITVRILLDTHIALWAIADDSRLKPTARALIEAPDNVVAVSAASIWALQAFGRSASSKRLDMATCLCRPQRP